MFITTLITDFKTRIFGSSNPTIPTIAPSFHVKCVDKLKTHNLVEPDLEIGEGQLYKNLIKQRQQRQQRQSDLELYSKPQNWDPEKCEQITIFEKAIADNIKCKTMQI